MASSRKCIANRNLGHSKLPASCPVCEHTPISTEDCKPNKSLRTTIRVYLRTEEKKREIARGHTQNEKPPESTSVSASDHRQLFGKGPSQGTVQHGGSDEKLNPQVIEGSHPKEKEAEAEKTEQVQKNDIQSVQVSMTLLPIIL